MDRVWEIADVMVEPGQRLELYVPIVESKETMPVTLINGRKNGKTVLITSGIHGGEYEGIRAATEIARELDPEEIYGQLMIIHPCSVQTFQAKAENITPDDGKNLNRVFPPEKNGTLTDKIAWTLWEKFQCKAEFHIDLHGCFSDWITPHVYYTGVASSEVIAKAKAAAEQVSVPYMVKSVATSGAYNHGGTHGIPGILLERGHTNLFSEEDIYLYKIDVRNVLRHLGVISGEKEPQSIHPVEVGELIYASSKSEYRGCWYPSIKVRDRLKKGDKIGEVKDFFGNVLDTTYATCDAVVLYMYGMMPIDANGFQICYAAFDHTCEDRKNLSN